MGLGKTFITSLRLGSSSVKLKGYRDSNAGREAGRQGGESALLMLPMLLLPESRE